MSAPRRAVVLLSGGMDSAVTLAWMRRAGFACTALSFDYGQRHRIELERAARLAAALGACEHVLQRIDLRAFGGSALTSDVAVPKDRLEVGGPCAPESGVPARATPATGAGRGMDGTAHSAIPITYVPARNTVFLSFALALAEVRGASAIAIGANAVDYSGYPDCRPEFITAFERLANLATRAGVEAQARGDRAITIAAPLLEMPKSRIVALGAELGVDFAMTTSCYDPDAQGRPCGHCDACVLRARGFAEAGRADPLARTAAHEARA
ncbi:MAG: 7-cyano-7-deazaguanine synthase [Phycisphaerales bacterium]|nr:7-cyano-7-deazaguanine synthase [Phycisphaerales bacterium]